MNEQEFNYITDNFHLLGNVKWTRDQQTVLFGMYNRITGENKPLTSCGRCVLNIKKRLAFEHEKRRISLQG